MQTRELMNLLAKLRFSAALPEELQSRLAAAASLVRFAAGTSIFRENGPEDRLFLLVNGRVALDMNVPGRGPQRILVVGSGELLGWSPVLGREQMTATATALEDTEAVAISATALRASCESDALFGYRLMQAIAAALAERLLMTRLQLLDLFADGAAPGQQIPRA